MSNTLNPSRPIVVVDDEKSILLSIDTVLHIAGLNNVICCQDSRRVMDTLSTHEVEVMLLDLFMPHICGEDLLTKMRHDFPEIPIIIVTGAVDVETAVRCMKSGAFDYVVKPVEESRLVTAVNNAIAFRELKRENLALKKHILSDVLEQPEAFAEIITNNKKMFSLFHYVESIAPTAQPVLITGETGVGKELVAKVIHELSGLAGGFVAVNVSGLDDNVFADTLFGHTRGAFTGADQARHGLVTEASGGTLLLDEIGDLSSASQVKLLRLLQEREFLPLGQDVPKHSDARIIATTNKDIWALQKAGKFRKDLIYRLCTCHVVVPPLRERLDDIPLLVEHFLDEASSAFNKKRPTPPKELFTLLEAYNFPGNIRELRFMVFDAVSRHESRTLSLEVFKSHMAQDQASKTMPMEQDVEETPLVAFPRKLPTIRQATELLIAESMRRSNGNQSVAARLLGISQQALSKRLRRGKSQSGS